MGRKVEYKQAREGSELAETYMITKSSRLRLKLWRH